MIARELSVRVSGETVGALVRFNDDRITLVFDTAFIERDDHPTLSQSFLDAAGGIVRRQRTTTRRAPPYFANLLPEGRLRSYLAAIAGVNETRDYPLLELTGADLPGAVELSPEHGSSRVETSSARHPAGTGPENDAGVLKFSLAGVQLKFSAIREARGGLTIPAHGLGGNWIVKLPSTTYAGVPENEFSIMSMASMVGIDVPEVRLVQMSEIHGLPRDISEAALAGANALAIRRFDRTEHGSRVHAEDFAQVLSSYPDKKYSRYGYGDIGRVLAAVSNSAAVNQFARRLIYSAMVGNADMHLKNWSLIYRDGRTPELSPAYDLLSTVAHLPDGSMALRLGGAKRWDELTVDAFTRLADRMAVEPDALLRPVLETIERFREVWSKQAGQLPVSEAVANAIERQLANVPIVTERSALKPRPRNQRASADPRGP